MKPNFIQYSIYNHAGHAFHGNATSLAYYWVNRNNEYFCNVKGFACCRPVAGLQILWPIFTPVRNRNIVKNIN